MTPRAQTCEEIKGFLYCSINVFHRFMIVSAAISFGLIHRGTRDSKLIADGRAWRVDGRAQVLVGPGLATSLPMGLFYIAPSVLS